MRSPTVAEAVETLYTLNTGVVGAGTARHERPHKPALLLAVFGALSTSVARPDRVTWSRWLRERFRVYFQIVQSHNDDCSPELPFFHLRRERFWQPVRIATTGEIPLGGAPLVGDADTGPVFARFVHGWDVLVADPVHRMVFRDALISRYFPHARTALAAHFVEPAVVGAPADLMVAEAESEGEEPVPGRSAAFFIGHSGDSVRAVRKISSTCATGSTTANPTQGAVAASYDWIAEAVVMGTAISHAALSRFQQR